MISKDAKRAISERTCAATRIEGAALQVRQKVDSSWEEVGKEQFQATVLRNVRRDLSFAMCYWSIGMLAAFLRSKEAGEAVDQPCKER